MRGVTSERIEYVMTEVVDPVTLYFPGSIKEGPDLAQAEGVIFRIKYGSLKRPKKSLIILFK